VLGFPVTAAALDELNELTIPDPHPTLRRVLLLPEHSNKDGVRRIAKTLSSRGARVSIEPANAPAIWRQEPMEAIVPFKLLRRIVTWLGEEQP
jgi:hypothetical protein